MCTCVEKDDRALGSGFQGFNKAGEVQALGSGVPVWVGTSGEAHVPENLSMISPGRVGEVELLILRTREVFDKEKSTKVNGSSTRDGLYGSNLFKMSALGLPKCIRGWLTRFSLMAGLSTPNMSFAEAEVNVPKPAIGKYSWLRAGSVFTLFSA